MSHPELLLSSVDAAHPTPLYHQVEADLRRLLATGALPPGATVPPEQDLARRYGVSRQTVRQALATAGRGTFVNAPPDRRAFYLDRSFTRQMADMGRQARSRVLSCAVGILDAEAPAPLHHAAGAPCLRLSRLRYGDDEPIGLQHTTLLTARCPGLERHDFAARSLYEILSTEYRLSVTEIRHAISATSADAAQAALLGIAPGDPLLLVHTTTFVDGRQPIEHTASFYRSDRYIYRTVHTCP